MVRNIDPASLYNKKEILFEDEFLTSSLKLYIERKIDARLSTDSFIVDFWDIGNNHIEGTFSFYLKSAFMLRVLVLRSNKFYDSITHPEPNATWPMLQIIGVASNNFIGKLPIILISTWTTKGNQVQSELNYLQTEVGGFYYQDII
jgi:hypothetical protein